MNHSLQTFRHVAVMIIAVALTMAGSLTTVPHFPQAGGGAHAATAEGHSDAMHHADSGPVEQAMPCPACCDDGLAGDCPMDGLSCSVGSVNAMPAVFALAAPLPAASLLTLSPATAVPATPPATDPPPPRR